MSHIRNIIAVFFTAGIAFLSYGKNNSPAELNRLSKAEANKDSLKNILQNKGSFQVHFRNYFMTTVNQADYPDYFAFATGGGIGYYSPIIRRFQAGISGYFVYNIISSSLSPNPPFSNRYEIGLFDVTNPGSSEVLNRVEDLYLRYYLTGKNKSFLQLGKFHLKTPLINLQDGRMQPNLQEGFWGEWNESKSINWKGGLLWRTSPRSTYRWYGIGNSLLYPAGRATNGEKAIYSANTNSDFIALMNMTWKPAKWLDYQFWNYYVDNLFNLSLNKIEVNKDIAGRVFTLGFQYMWQRSLFNDTLEIAKQYITQGEQSHSFSGQLGMIANGRKWNVNYTRITRHGRFLFPREWGIEPFYTFLQRERNEGAGDVHAASVQHIRYQGSNKQWELMGGAGMYWMPSVLDARLNKYAMPSYYQLNFRSRYQFQGFLQGLRLEMLYVYKGNLSNEIEVQPLYYHNKVNMHHLSVTVDYNF